MILFFLFAIVSSIFSFIFKLLPCGVVSDSCSVAFLPLPAAVGSAFSLFANAGHYFIYLFGDPIGDAIYVSLRLIIGVTIAQLAWRTLLYFKVPIVTNVMNALHANVSKN